MITRLERRQFWTEFDRLAEIGKCTPLLEARDIQDFLIDKLLERNIIHCPNVEVYTKNCSDELKKALALYSLHFQLYKIIWRRMRSSKLTEMFPVIDFPYEYNIYNRYCKFIGGK